MAFRNLNELLSCNPAAHNKTEFLFHWVIHWKQSDSIPLLSCYPQMFMLFMRKGHTKMFALNIYALWLVFGLINKEFNI